MIAHSAIQSFRDAVGREAEILNQRRVKWGMMAEDRSVRPEARQAAKQERLRGGVQSNGGNDGPSAKRVKSDGEPPDVAGGNAKVPIVLVRTEDHLADESNLRQQTVLSQTALP